MLDIYIFAGAFALYGLVTVINHFWNDPSYLKDNSEHFERDPF